MPKYNFTLSSAEVRHKLAEDLTVEMMAESKWKQFMGTTDFHIIKTANATDEGDLAGTVTMRMRGVLTGDGVEGNEDFNTNDEVLLHLYQTVSLDNFGNSVKSGENLRLLKQVHFTKFEKETKTGLKDWGIRKMDTRIYTDFSTNCTNVVYCGHHGSIAAADVKPGNVLTIDDILEGVRRGESGEDALGNPVPQLKPIQVKIDDVHGTKVTRKIYVMKIGAASSKNLKLDPRWEAMQQNASSNNLDSPLFSSKLGVVEDVILIKDGTWKKEEAGILTSDQIPAYAGTGVKTEINLLLGATAGLMPMDTGFTWYEDKYDSNRKAIISVDRDFGFAKTKFQGKTTAEQASVWHNKDYGVIAIVAAVK